HPPSAGNSPKPPYHDVFMGAMPSSRRGNTSPFRWGKRRTQEIPFLVNNNRADIKITVAIPGDRRPPISSQASQPLTFFYAADRKAVTNLHGTFPLIFSGVFFGNI
ncbi:hypothetical protein TNCV_2802771, partial [Trichonephila clavipes]